jgi:hypothetical protein
MKSFRYAGIAVIGLLVLDLILVGSISIGSSLFNNESYINYFQLPVSIILSIFLYLGFFKLGKIKNNKSLKVTSCLMIVTNLVFRPFVSLYLEKISQGVFTDFIISGLFLAVPLILFGISLATIKENNLRFLGILVILLGITNNPFVFSAIYSPAFAPALIIAFDIIIFATYTLETIIFFDYFKKYENNLKKK